MGGGGFVTILSFDHKYICLALRGDHFLSDNTPAYHLRGENNNFSGNTPACHFRGTNFQKIKS